ncbi:hypothetical protein CAMRE0001_1270 [Campylobacter rectus RM3267]|uniref:Uncharacterized protein n=1 Tax=Campylobacter rectus RM3267 TaxID=553218 RepID=B9D0R0_CAMRE|nr:hypothetical protein CAMRE0001_1270 [Campylobacter rectus RM3267]
MFKMTISSNLHKRLKCLKFYRLNFSIRTHTARMLKFDRKILRYLFLCWGLKLCSALQFGLFLLASCFSRAKRQ